MAKIISVEKSKYINQNIEIYNQNKIGQYSKFLNKNPIFVTYYSINIQQSRSDTGTGGIQSEYGPTSPIRFNKIKNLPVYNLPTINPDIEYDESGYDLNIDLSDIIILPNTVKPTPGDYMLLDFPGIKQFLFRVNNFKYNTIQSNDYYQIDIDIKEIGTNLEETTLKNQIVETYQTVFDNIGTQDKCFIIDSDVEKINGLVRTLEAVKETYKNLFYNNQLNSFLAYIPVDYAQCPLQNNCNCAEEVYDPYLSKFINNSNIYYVNNSEKCLILTPNDTLPPDFEYLFSRSIWNAILRRNLELLHKYMYYYTSRVSNAMSPFVIEHHEVDSVKLYMATAQLNNGELNNSNITIRLNTGLPTGTISKEYFDISLIEQISNKQLTSTDYLDKIIYNYFNNISDEIDKDLLIQATINSSERVFKYTPMIIYILNVYYNEYFKRTENDIF